MGLDTRDSRRYVCIGLAKHKDGMLNICPHSSGHRMVTAQDLMLHRKYTCVDLITGHVFVLGSMKEMRGETSTPIAYWIGYPIWVPAISTCILP